MTPEAATCEWWLLDERQPVSLAELARTSGMSTQEVAELVEYGCLVPSPGTSGDLSFSGEYVHPLREAARLRVLFDLDTFTVGLVTEYLHRIELLEHRVRALEGRLPPHEAHPPRDGPASWHEPHA